MNTYLIPKSQHHNLNICVGSLYNFTIEKNEFIIIVHGAECYDESKKSNVNNYLDYVKIRFINFSYLKLELIYEIFGKDIKNQIEIGEIKEGDELLIYGGGISGIEDLGAPTGHEIEIVCQDIELEFLDQAQYQVFKSN